jgi:hypothetical protein
MAPRRQPAATPPPVVLPGVDAAGVRIALALAVGALAMFGATRRKRGAPTGCAAAVKPRADAHRLQLATSHVQWLAGAPRKRVSPAAWALCSQRGR